MHRVYRGKPTEFTIEDGKKVNNLTNAVKLLALHIISLIYLGRSSEAI